MLDALILRMTGPAPEARSGDAPDERRAGYVNFGDVVSAIRLAIEPLHSEVARLREDMRYETRQQTQALARQFEDHEREAHARDEQIAEIKAWIREQELEEATRAGFKKTSLMVGRWLFEHWPALLSLGFSVALTLTGIVWALTSGGAPVVQVQP